jgi:MFS family permease
VTLAAAPLLAAALTRDPAMVALVSFAQRLPWLLFTLLSGALADRFDRRRLMGSVDAFRAVLVGLLCLAVYAGWATVALLCAVFFLLGTAETLFTSASQAMLPSIVSRERLAKANGRLEGARIVANMLVGPPLGGFLFAVAAAAPFLLDAGTFAVAAALVLAIRVSSSAERPAVAKPTVTTLWAEIREGLTWLFEQRLLRVLAVSAGVVNLGMGALLAVLVLYAQDVLGLGASGYGLLLTSVALGGLAGSLAAERVVARLGEGRTLLCVLLASAACYTTIAAFGNVILVGAALAIEGSAIFIWNVVAVSLRQALVPEHLLGRVTSSYLLLSFGGAAAGALLGGLVARALGLAAPFWFAAVGLLLLALVVWPVVNNRTVAEAREGR